jgi:alkanesulfonate monooxygenase SsuD/methylene tetrahydromethanopterin reductase-like flavin-dependent oxidoreductase (luciferase family)
MELGAGLITCQRRADDDRSHEELYDEGLQYARTAEESGLDSVWVSEHHFADDAYMPGVMPMLGAIAAETESVEIGTSIALAPFYDPIRLAEDAATVELLAPGRMTLGLGVGYVEREFDWFGVPMDERAARIEDAIRVCQGAWTPGPLDYDSDFHPAPPEATVTPTPGREPPIMLGGSSKPAVRRAARMTEGWCAPSARSLEELAVRRRDIESIREAEGIDGDFTYYAMVHGFVADSEEDAWERMREGFVHAQNTYAKFFTGKDVEVSDEKFRELKDDAVYGTPEQVTERLAEYEEVLGDDCHVIFRSYQPGIGTETLLGCLERLGEEVAPEL